MKIAFVLTIWRFLGFKGIPRAVREDHEILEWNADMPLYTHFELSHTYAKIRRAQ